LTLLVYIPAVAFLPVPLTGPDGQTPTLPNPAGQPALRGIVPYGNSLVNLAYTAGGLVLLASAAAPLVRARRARGDEREQVRWIAYVVLVTATANVLITSGFVFAPAYTSLWNVLLSQAVFLGFGVGLPVAAGIAIFKYR